MPLIPKTAEANLKRMASKHLQRLSISLAIREVQIKTTIGLHSTPTRMAKTQNRE